GAAPSTARSFTSGVRRKRRGNSAAARCPRSSASRCACCARRRRDCCSTWWRRWPWLTSLSRLPVPLLEQRPRVVRRRGVFDLVVRIVRCLHHVAQQRDRRGLAVAVLAH